jgi:uncharacterized protein involved in type VI secretion and phage assembly
VAISIAGVEPSLAGKWVISGSRHEFGTGAYRTHLEFSGRQDRSIHGLLTQGEGSGGTSRHVQGVVVALVSENEDPLKMGRVKLSYPWLAENAVSDWARIAMPGAGNGYGVMWLPQVGDEVLVAFQHGDMNHPIVIGGLWNGQDVIPFDYDGDLTPARSYCGSSRTGHKISFWEGKNDSSIQLLTTNGAVNVVLDDKNKTVRIECTDKVVIDAKGDVEIKAGGAMKLEASGQMTIKGATVAIN